MFENLTICWTSSKLQEELKSRSTSHQKCYEDIKHSSPDIFVETPSTATLLEESNSINPNFLSPWTDNQKKKEKLLINWAEPFENCK